MIPILYESNETKFESNGLGLLADCVSCVVSEERNGNYTIEFEYPVSGIHYEDITVGRFVACTHDDMGDVQPFIIYKKEIPDINGIVRFYGYHISYLLSNIIVKPFSAQTLSAALHNLKVYSANNNPFTFWTNRPDVKEFSFDVPRLIRNTLGGEDNSILDVYGGGEYEFDKFTVRLYENRGKDSGVTIRYGINLANLSYELDNASTYNAVAPYWRDTEGNVVYLPEGVVAMDDAEGHRIDAIPLDLTDRYEEMPTVEELREAGKNAINSGKAWRPTENLKVDFVQLWQTEEYAEYADLQRVSLCDTVTVLYPVFGVSAVKQKVIRTVYNVLLERYDSIELGVLQTTLGKAIESSILEVVPTKERVENSIRYESDLLRGGLGGYVVMPPGENRYPEEILIMDTPDKETAQNVWRWNKQGIGYSPNGYHGPFTTAWTIDGKFVADFIQAGTLSDEQGNNTWNLETGDLVTRSLTAVDYLYVWGDERTFFRVPYGIDDEGYLQLSTEGFEIKIKESMVRSDDGDFGSGGLGDNVPVDTDDIGSLLLEWTDWDTIISPFSVTINKWDSEGVGLYESTLYPGQLIVYSGKNGDGIQFDTALREYEIVVGTGAAGLNFEGGLYIDGALAVTGSKNRAVKTDNYSERLFYCYETPTPLFGDIGQATLDEDGTAYIEVDDIFSEAIADRVEYQVFLQKEGEGDCWISDKTPRYFVIQGTPGMRVAWELKAKQRGYEMERFEQWENGLEEYAETNVIDDSSEYLKEQEVLLYGEY